MTTTEGEDYCTIKCSYSVYCRSNTPLHTYAGPFFHPGVPALPLHNIHNPWGKTARYSGHRNIAHIADHMRTLVDCNCRHCWEVDIGKVK